MKKIKTIALVSTLIGTVLPFNITQVNALSFYSDDLYYLVDFSTDQELDSYSSYSEAVRQFSLEEENYENLGIMQNGVTLKAERAIVILATDEACEYEVATVDSYTGEDGSLNGCYGIDAAYLDTNSDGTEVEYLISNGTFTSSLDEVTILPLEWINSRISMYLVRDGILYHEIKAEIDDDDYSYIVSIDEAPEYLSDGSTYYSYDGHYFYLTDDLYLMLDDYRNDTREQSVNPEDPYYNYYQFVSQRTVTSASQTDIESYFKDELGLRGQLTSYSDQDKDGSDDTLTRSQMYGNFSAFWQFQYEYGVNALMMMAMSEIESSFGRSSLSYNRNNLFSHAAFDNEEEANVSRFNSVANSIYSHAKYYISGTYSSPLKTQYHGSYFGNKTSGMNVAYSEDPYWGEKVASYYRDLDASNDYEDKNLYTLAIHTDRSSVNVYDWVDGSIVYSTDEMSDQAFVVLWEEGDYYAVQMEATVDEDKKIDLSYSYTFSTDYGYIRKDEIDVLIEGKYGYYVPTYTTVTFDASGGTFAGGETSVTYEMPIENDYSITIPTRENSMFVGWETISESTEASSYVATYKDVDSIEITSMPKTEYELNDRIDLSSGVITVHFSDGTEEIYQMTTSMVSGYDLSQASTQTVNVSLAGCTTSYEITVSEELDAIRAEIKSEIEEVLEIYGDAWAVTGEDADRIIALKMKIDENVLPYLTQSQLRVFDTIIRLSYQGKIRYIIDRNSLELGVSGLCTSIPLDPESLTKNRFSKDTYRVQVENEISTEAENAMRKSALFLESTPMESFSISIQKNMEDATISDPLVFTINKPEGAESTDVYTVLYYDENGDVIECYTRQTTNCITFMSSEVGEFVLVARSTSNEYTGEDPVESLTSSSNSYDMEWFLIEVSVGLAFILILIIILRQIRKRRRAKVAAKQHQEHIEKVEKEVEDLEVTQALHILDTQMLNLDELKELEEEHDQHDR